MQGQASWQRGNPPRRILNYGESFGFSSEAAIFELPGLIETVFPRRTPVLPPACYLALRCHRFADVSGRYWPQSSLTRQNCNFVDRRKAVVDMSLAIDGSGELSDSRRSARSCRPMRGRKRQVQADLRHSAGKGEWRRPRQAVIKPVARWPAGLHWNRP